MTAGVAISGFGGCAGAPPTVTSGKSNSVGVPSVSAHTSAAAAIPVGRARFIPLASDSWQPHDSIESSGSSDSPEDQRTLYVGSAGQRWLVRTEKAPLPADPDHERYVLTGAATMAPETLIAVRKRKGFLVFLGESGATYTAKGALEPFDAVRAPPEPLRAAAMGKDAILAITRRDTLIRSTDDGVTFSPLTTPTTATTPLQILANARGEALVVSAPGKLLASRDDGVSMTWLAPGGLGPTSFVRASDGGLFARGYAATATKPPGLAAITTANALLSATGSLERTTKGPAVLARPLNDDEHFDFGDAVQTGHAVFNELGYLEVHSGEEGLVASILGGLGASAGPAGQKVTTTTLVGSRDCELVAVAGVAAHVVVECVRSVETPKGSREDLVFFRSADFGKTFTPEGTAVASPDGVRNVAMSSKGSIFATGINDGIMFRPPGAKSFTAAKVPKGYAPQKMLIAPDGERVHVVATGGDDGTPALLSSHDGGKTFIASAAPIDHLDDTIHLAYDNGTFAAFVVGDPATRHATRDDGVTWDTRELKLPADWISMAGARGLATSNNVGYETLDFGLTWGPVPLPHGSAVGGTLPVACSAVACLLGDVAIREGWELATAADLKPVVTKPARKNVNPPPIDCVVEGDEIELGTISEPELEPTANVAWSAVSESATGALDVLTWPTNAKAIVRVPLLPAPKEPVGVRRWTGDDGVIVVRAARGDGKVLADLEVAWWVASTNRVHRAVLGKATTSLGKWGTPSAVAAIVPGFGLYVRPGNSTETALFLVREGSTTAVKAVLKDPFPSFTRVFARRSSKGTVFIGPAREGSEQAVLFATLTDGGSLTTHAWGLWPRIGVRSELLFSGDYLALAANSDDLRRSFILPWKDGAVDPPEPTKVSELATCTGPGARVDLPWVTGARTPITIKRAKSTLYHATRTTTARVGGKLCARGILAGTPHAVAATEWTLIPSDDPLHGFLFARANKVHVLARLSCAPSKTPLPIAFVNANGFHE